MEDYKKTVYTSERQDKYFGIEDASWWFQYRAKVFLYLGSRFLKKWIDTIDIGGSNGFNTLKFQEKGYSIRLVEPTEQACKNAERRGVDKICSSTIQEYNEKFGQFLLLDVVEHIEDDRAFLEDIFRKQIGGGRGIIAVPGGCHLWSSEDNVDGHFRRYTERGLVRVAEDAGFDVLYITYIFRFLWLPIFLLRHLAEKLPFIKTVPNRTEKEEKAITDKQFIASNGVIRYILDIMMRMEFKRIRQGKKNAFGSSIVCVVERPKEK